MTLDLSDCTFVGPALPEPFVQFQLEDRLRKAKVLPKEAGAEGRELQESWDAVRRKLRALGPTGGALRVQSHVLESLVGRLGYERLARADAVRTREGDEDGGCALTASDGARLRTWSLAVGTDLDAPSRRGRAYRFSPMRVAERVLLAANERVGLLTDGEEMRLLLLDPAARSSHVAIRLDRSGWRGARSVPDSYRLLLALASPQGVALVPSLVEDARLAQTGVTKKLRRQARLAIEGFLQEVLDHPANSGWRDGTEDPAELARGLWREGLVLVYRLLFVLTLEASPDPARVFSFASSSLWRRSYSPSTALADVVRRVLDHGADTGSFLEHSLRALFRLFASERQLSSSEMHVTPLGGALFGAGTTPTLDGLVWGERAVALLLDRLLWTPRDGRSERERVHYGTLDVEDLGRVYESLLELEPGIATERMCRLRRAKLEVVVPLAQGEPYRPADAAAPEGAIAEDDEDESEDESGEPPARRRGGTKVRFEEEIAPGRFFLRVGLGRKASGAYYTPTPFVRFLVQETLRPQVEERSPADDPRPAAILALKVLDPAMGSGHFLVEACRFLGAALYEACRLCDELAGEAEEAAERSKDAAERERHAARARELRERVEALPDPNDELVAYLPSRVAEGEESGLSQRKAEALCRRLVAVHSLYGVDKNPLAVELAKLALWLESYAEGLPLTFLDHRLVAGDSLTGPFAEHLATFPVSGERMDDLYAHGLAKRLQVALANALTRVRDLEASIGTDVADLQRKRTAKTQLDEALKPLRRVALAWNGAAMVGDERCDLVYEKHLNALLQDGFVASDSSEIDHLIRQGRDALPYELVFPEVFYGQRGQDGHAGFDCVIGNPPWDSLQPLAKEYFAAYDLRILDAPTRRERAATEKALLDDPATRRAYERYVEEFSAAKRLIQRYYTFVGRQAGGRPSGAMTDLWQVFAERNLRLSRRGGFTGLILPSAFHANQSATGIRTAYLTKCALACCFSFENRRKLFDIHRSFKFAAVVARRDPRGTDSFRCAFYLHDLEWLFSGAEPLAYTLDFVRKTGGEYLTFLELRAPADTEVAKQLFGAPHTFESFCTSRGIRFASECHMAKDSWRFTPTEDVLAPGEDPRDPEVAAQLLTRGYLPLHEGKTFHQYDDRWGDRPRYCVALEKLEDKPGWLHAACIHRLAFRDIARSTDERTGIFCMAPAGVTFGHTAICERDPKGRRLADAMICLSSANSFSFDWALRQKSAAHVSLFLLSGCPFPKYPGDVASFLAHSSLRLVANHDGYSSAWGDQLGEAWRESGPPATWPALPNPLERQALVARVDAVVAHAYGLTRDQYVHVLASFPHTSAPDLPDSCLAAFDEIAEDGVEAFVQKHDPYADVPLNVRLPEPVLDLVPRRGTSATSSWRDRDGQTSFVAPSAGPLYDTPTRVAEATPERPAAADAPGSPREPNGRKERPPLDGHDLYARLRDLLRTKGTLTSTDAQAATGRTAAELRPHLKRLVADGLATQEGRRRGTRYVWNHDS